MNALPQSIGILGEGVTAKAVTSKLETLPDFKLVPPKDADLIIASPGIPPDQYPPLKGDIISDIEFAYRLFRRPKSTYCPKIIGVTGTNGKTTVTTLLAEILQVPATGNIGVPLINYVDHETHHPWLVVELSSYQLANCTTFRPDIALLLNLAEDHLLWHGSFDHYAQAKAMIFNNQTSSDTLIYTDDCTFLSQAIESAPSNAINISLTGKAPFDFSKSALKGKHNELNCLIAYHAAEKAGVAHDRILQGIETFKPLSHRLEKVISVEGRAFYNDSKSTNLDATTKAVHAFNAPIHLILCGQDKQLPVEEWLNTLQESVYTITVFGDIADRLFDTAKKIDPLYPISKFNTLEDSVTHAYQLSLSGHIILFSPSSASFDQFKNYEERGAAFSQIAHRLV